MPSTCCMLQMCWQFRKMDFNDVLYLYVTHRTDYKSRGLCGSWRPSKMRGVRRIQHSVKRVVFQQWRQTLFILSWASSSGLLVTFRHHNKRYLSVFQNAANAPSCKSWWISTCCQFLYCSNRSESDPDNIFPQCHCRCSWRGGWFFL